MEYLGLDALKFSKWFFKFDINNCVIFHVEYAETLILVCYVNVNFNTNNISSRTQGEDNIHKGTRSFNMVQPTMLTFMDEREYFTIL